MATPANLAGASWQPAGAEASASFLAAMPAGIASGQQATPSLQYSGNSGAAGESNAGFSGKEFAVNLGSGSAGGSSISVLLVVAGAALAAAIVAGWRP